LKSLKTLELRNNALESLPDNICELNLNKLDISNNLLRNLPRGMHSLKTLRILDLKGNNFDDARIESNLDHSLSSLMDFLEKTESITRA